MATYDFWSCRMWLVKLRSVIEKWLTHASGSYNNGHAVRNCFFSVSNMYKQIDKRYNLSMVIINRLIYFRWVSLLLSMVLSKYSSWIFYSTHGNTWRRKTFLLRKRPGLNLFMKFSNSGLCVHAYLRVRVVGHWIVACVRRSHLEYL